ncbi:MAG: hypothetical protein COX82_04870 [Candidatus Magasanikbacteria bacterium CG_4_10_14_0_2_um_filter_41_10]|uniref:PsbP C-terminal domain-containing protein n=1 Tax=Candidatus Magasanikbacteria bacterium CG_4_10_14_0_2_um_filter_41_10 TaxID=1974638 RepID=A0A2M7V1Z9_9BACT|nr:MAG: hypothetical protein COX82_04870 [Candidatus Magasanikbacteria bacterium CG_4_10_14_0_2_um_filter_41_10]
MSKKIVLIGGSIFLLVLLGGGIYFYMASTPPSQKQPIPVDTNEVTVQKMQEVSPSNVPEKQAQQDRIDVAFETYSNEEEGISIDYPKNWTVSEGSSPTVATFASPLQNSDDTFQETVGIMVQDSSAADLSLEEFRTQATTALSQYIQNLQIVSEDDDELDGEPAKSILFSGTYPTDDHLSETYQIYTVYDGYVYIITYTGMPDDFETLMPTVKDMLASFSF